MRMALTMAELRMANLARCEVFGHSPTTWSASQWAVAMCGEVGEALNEVKKLWRGDGVGLARELADVLIYADFVANRCGLGPAGWFPDVGSGGMIVAGCTLIDHEWYRAATVDEEAEACYGLMTAATNVLRATFEEQERVGDYLKRLVREVTQVAMIADVPFASAIIETFNAKSDEKGSAIKLAGVRR